jgi:hypothetical protein
MINPYKKRITTSATTTIVSVPCLVLQIVIACAVAGTTWKLKIQDQASSPFVLVPELTLAVPTDGPIILKFDEPIPMDVGVDVVTTGGSPGEVGVCIIAVTN